MTASFAPDDLWRTMPGWGITADLLPPEIVVARRTRVLRKYVLSAIVLVLLLGVAGYFYALTQKNAADSALQAEQARTTVLRVQQSKYDAVVTVAGDIQSIAAQLSQLLGDDVDMTALLDKVTAAEPRGTISSLQLAIATDSQAPVSAGAGVLDSSGHVHVGSLSITGVTGSLSDVAGYVVKLNKIPGIVTAFPSSASSDTKSVTYTIQATLTDQVFSHKFDALATAAGPTQGGH